MHRYRSPNDGGDGRLRSGIEDDTDTGSSFYVKYNRTLHGKGERKLDTLTIQFLKKNIHYAKNRIEPKLKDEHMRN
ncbi:hypothetical protein MKW98_021705 [Papaver atlanticum]|uniref:Uncharacterized protein n=1 Tax=Papaver atlanticum TaxID=357466 RepID=A0AAD4XDF2_9MAGN|nr:hypothetical protein MKW98_021705 [Papaver atlanticum]